VGSILLVGALVVACRGSLGFYEEYYFIPKEKYGILTPLRWQDVLFLVSFYLLMIVLFYVSYRLLKHAFRREPSVTA